MIKKILAAAALSALAIGSQAATNVQTTGSFENTGYDGNYCYGSGAAGNCSSADLTGWVRSSVVLISSVSPDWSNPSATAGSIDLGSYVDGVQGNTDLASTVLLTAGYTYSLTWDDAGRAQSASQSYDVTAGGVDIGTFSTTSGQSWASHSFSFIAATDSALSFAGLDGLVDGTSFVDNISLTVTAVPEPASVVLMIVGVFSLLAWRRRAQV